MQLAGFTVESHFTEYSGHATEIAFSLKGRTDLALVVAIGGDGTAHEVASGLRGSNLTMGIIPLGSGDDLARAMGIPRKDIPAAIMILKNGVDHHVGAVRVEAPPAVPPSNMPQYKMPTHHEANGDINVQGNIVKWSFVETDCGVTSAVSRMKSEGIFDWVKGQLKYQLLGVRAILGWKPQKAWLKLNQEGKKVIDLQGLFVIQMCETFGGGFRGAPTMHPKRNYASIVTALGLTKMQMLRVMGPLKEGDHVGMFGCITQDKCQQFEIGACNPDGTPSETIKHEPLLYVNVDGESCLTTPASFEFYEKQLKIRGGVTIPNEDIDSSF
jgi:diacylglycerol kinase family enzyme